MPPTRSARPASRRRPTVARTTAGRRRPTVARTTACNLKPRLGADVNVIGDIIRLHPQPAASPQREPAAFAAIAHDRAPARQTPRGDRLDGGHVPAAGMGPVPGRQRRQPEPPGSRPRPRRAAGRGPGLTGRPRGAPPPAEGRARRRSVAHGAHIQLLPASRRAWGKAAERLDQQTRATIEAAPQDCRGTDDEDSVDATTFAATLPV